MHEGYEEGLSDTLSASSIREGSLAIGARAPLVFIQWASHASSSSSTHISNCSGSAPWRKRAISAARLGLGFQAPSTCSASVMALSSGFPIINFMVALFGG